MLIFYAEYEMVHLVNVCRYKKVVVCQTILQGPKLHLGIKHFEGCCNQSELRAIYALGCTKIAKVSFGMFCDCNITDPKHMYQIRK